MQIMGAVIGGLGLFLLAIGMMTDGLKQAAGASLRNLLSAWSKTTARGIFSGFTMTSVVQSSSAVTVAALGFVNAGLINMRQALGIIYGANVGTTMTAWLVALLGFKFNIQAFALPLIGVGMMLRLIRKQGRSASIGLALVGFGLFFIGIDVLKMAFEGLVAAFDITQLTTNGIQGIVVFLFAGILMTVLTQSSSASIAITITAASSSLIGPYLASAMIIGANIGTTSTALFASIGATSNAKRVATAQIIFNFVTGIVALGILPIIFWFIQLLPNSVSGNIAISLALFHTIFNVLGVLLIYPFNDNLAHFLENRFVSWEERESNPRYLDLNVAQTPALAANAIILELQSLSEKIVKLYQHTIKLRNHDRFIPKNEIETIKQLSNKISNFIVKVESTALTNETTQELTQLMRVNQYYLDSALSIQLLAQHLSDREKVTEKELEKPFKHFLKCIEEFLIDTTSVTLINADLLLERLESIKKKHDEIKALFLSEGTQSNISLDQMSDTIESLAEALAITKQWYKSIKWLSPIKARVDSEANRVTDDERESND